MSKMGRYIVDSMERFGYVKPLKPRCPHARHTGGYSAELDEYIEGADMCDIVDKWCLLEGGMECETYNEFLKEEEDERDKV